jgi:hypothetical protein
LLKRYFDFGLRRLNLAGSTPRFLQPARGIYGRVIILFIHPARMVNKKPAEAGFLSLRAALRAA